MFEPMIRETDLVPNDGHWVKTDTGGNVYLMRGQEIMAGCDINVMPSQVRELVRSWMDRA